MDILTYYFQHSYGLGDRGFEAR